MAKARARAILDPVPHQVRPLARSRRRALLTTALVVFLVGLSITGLQVSISRADEACYDTPAGYLEQRVVDVRRTWWSVDCVMDPGNGDPSYTIHRPWQSVRPIKDIDGDHQKVEP